MRGAARAITKSGWRGDARWLAGCWLAGWLMLSGLPLRAGPIGADAVVLVNSTSTNYPDFQHYLQSYLDNFGVPYSVLDIASNTIGTNIGNYAVIIIGHSRIDTSQTHLNAAAQSNLVAAVANGSGLVNFDSALTNGAGTNGYPFVQSIFGFGYGAAVTGTNLTFPATEPAGQMHYVTALHASNSTVALAASMSVPGLTYGSNVTALVLDNGKPLVAVAKYGQGRAVQWGSYDWMRVAVKGPMAGLDDLVWRSIVWAARKPFVMRGLPNLVTMRVDDCDGGFVWAQIAGESGFKPYISFYVNVVSETNAAFMRGLVTNGVATASIHAFASANLFYANQGIGNYSDSVMASNMAFGLQWHTNHGIPISKVVAPHYSQIGPNAFTGFASWGAEYIAIEVVPGTIEYGTPPAPWLVAGPYRKYETPGTGESVLPFFYADFLPIPGHPELNGQIFDVYTEVRDDAACGEWCPDNDVAGTIGRGTRQLKRALDGMAMGTLFTHEAYIDGVSGSTNAAQTNGNNWRSILQGITNNLAAYNPNYVTLDYACQYIRATRTSRLASAAFDAVTGLVTASFTGSTDLATKMNIYTGADNGIDFIAGDVPVLAGPATVSVPVQPMLQGAMVGGNFVLSFNAVSNATYTVEHSTATNGWSTLTNLRAATTNVSLTNPIGGDQKLFRVSAPGH